jgi:hypothetical protein
MMHILLAEPLTVLQINTLGLLHNIVLGKEFVLDIKGWNVAAEAELRLL